MRGMVFDIKKYSVNDGPGIRTTVFLKGCPLSCQWCHNPESQSRQSEILYRWERCLGCHACLGNCPNEAISLVDSVLVTHPDLCQRCGVCAQVCPSEAREQVGTSMTVDEVMRAVVKDRLFFDESGGGVSFSGGEPLMQGAFLMAMLDASRQREVHSVVDTCGLADSALLLDVAKVADLILYDLKIMDVKKHEKFTGVSNEKILENLKLLADRNAKIEIRVPLIPGVTDDDDNIDRIGDFVAALPGVSNLSLLPYHQGARGKHERFGRDFPLGELPALSPGRVAMLKRRLLDRGLNIKIGG